VLLNTATGAEWNSQEHSAHCTCSLRCRDPRKKCAKYDLVGIAPSRTLPQSGERPPTGFQSAKAPINQPTAIIATYCTVNLTDVLRSTPLVPRILMVKVPVDVDPLVLIVNLEVPLPVTELGLKLALEFAGSPRAEKVTVPLKPLSAVMVTV